MKNDKDHFGCAIEKGFDSSFYLEFYEDVRKVYGESADALFKHFVDYGMSEGRLSNRLAVREHMIAEISAKKSVLEIGPFTNPMVTGANVKYFEVMDKDRLVERASKLGRPIDTAVDIDFLDPNGDISVVDAKFDAVVSSHSIEHQPNLVSHLKNVGDILNPDGVYFVFCPDKRYCFDYFIPETTTIDVLVANKEEREYHTLQKVVEHRTLVAHNDPSRHWAGDHGSMRYSIHGVALLQDAFKEFDDAAGSYIDVHAWQFSPSSFTRVINELFDFGYIDIYVDTIYPTPRNRLEFIAVLRVGER